MDWIPCAWQQLVEETVFVGVSASFVAEGVISSHACEEVVEENGNQACDEQVAAATSSLGGAVAEMPFDALDLVTLKQTASVKVFGREIDLAFLVEVDCVVSVASGFFWNPAWVGFGSCFG